MAGMVKLKLKTFVAELDETKLSTLKILDNASARAALAMIWGASAEDLVRFFAVVYDKKIKEISDDNSFIALSFSNHGFVLEPDEPVNIEEAEKQIEIDLEIINRESQWHRENSIYFAGWWPKPHYNTDTKTLEFGVALRDFSGNIINRTINRLILTRYGHILMNYSLSEDDVLKNEPLETFTRKLDELQGALIVEQGYRYEDIMRALDKPSRSRMINLLLSSEIF